MKDGSEKFIKEKVRDSASLDKKEKMKSVESKKGSRMTPNTDDIIKRYPGSYANEAASPGVKSKHQDLNMKVNPKKKN